MLFRSILLVQTVGVYLYSRGAFTIKQSLINIVKLPVIWVSAVALGLNLSGIELEENLFRSLEMGAHTCLVLQLLTFGIFLSTIKTNNIDYKLITFMNIFKFIITPIVVIAILRLVGFEPFVASIILFQLTVPLAVNNINFAALYNTQPTKVATLVVSSSVIFMLYVFALNWLIDTFIY